MANCRGLQPLRHTLCRSCFIDHRSKTTWARRSYHSYEHESAPPFTSAENTILSASITHVPTYGFTVDALSRGARDVGYQDVSVNLFPAGAFALVQHHLVIQRLVLAECRELETDDDLGIAANVEKLALKRLHANKAIIHRWQEALALMAMPSNVPTSIRELALLSDEILFRAGDTSVDTSWYMKRAALSAVYASAELFMTTDKSYNFRETEAFLKRRLNESSNFGGALRHTGSWLGVQARGVLNSLRSKGVRI